MKHSTLIYNPIAGRHPKRRAIEIRNAAKALERAGFEVQLQSTTGPGTATELSRSAAAAGTDLLLVCGGDGTVNEVINGLAPSTIPLGILPGGTANILGKELGLPHDPVLAAEQLSRWSPRRIALGRAVGYAQASPRVQAWAAGPEIPACRYFASVAGIGFDAHIVYKLSPEAKMSYGVAGYVFEAFRQVVRYPFPVFACRVDGREHVATFAVVHRTRLYAGWLHLAPSANLFEARLTLCLFRSRRWTRYLLYATAVLVRQHHRLWDVEVVDAQHVSCAGTDSKEKIRFELDGELAGTLPVTFEIVPDAMTLLVP